ncbi:hypothetical protein BC567DRAFT_284565, partial [Phyllosticta citribraziliensis]
MAALSLSNDECFFHKPPSSLVFSRHACLQHSSVGFARLVRRQGQEVHQESVSRDGSKDSSCRLEPDASRHLELDQDSQVRARLRRAVPQAHLPRAPPAAHHGGHRHGHALPRHRGLDQAAPVASNSSVRLHCRPLRRALRQLFRNPRRHSRCERGCCRLHAWSGALHSLLVCWPKRPAPLPCPLTVATPHDTLVALPLPSTTKRTRNDATATSLA